MKIKSFLLLLLITTEICADTIKTPTLHDLVPGGKNYFRFMPQSIRQLQWCGDKYIFVQNDSLMQALPDKKNEYLAFTLQQLSKTIETEGYAPLTTLPYFSVPDKTKPQIAFKTKDHHIIYDLDSQKIVMKYEQDKNGENWEYDTAEGNFAFTKENNVFILTPSGETQQVTDETNKGIVCGTAVHQREFGIEKGLFWSPRGALLAFYRMDETMIPIYPAVNVNGRIAQLLPFKYPMAGTKSHEVTVGIYRLSDKSTIWLNTGLPKEKYLTNITWSPDEKFVYIAELNRGQDTCKTVRYDAKTGQRDKELFTETNTKYVEPRKPIQFLPGDTAKFICESRRDGYNHLYLYNTDKQTLIQLTKGKWLVKEYLGFDEKGINFFYTSTAPKDPNATTEGNPLEIYAWKQNLKTGKRTRLHSKTGIHHTSINHSGTYLIDNISSPAMPRDVDIVNTRNGNTTKSLLSAKNPFQDYLMPDIKTGTIKAADRITDLYYRLITPPNMNTAEKHPVIIYVYGGPHAQLVTGGWMNGAGGWDIYMASKGYVMFTLDNRGSANRGFFFESVIHRHLGDFEMADQMKGVEFLKTLPFVDSERIGVFGWSYGGFMTTNLMLTFPDVFKAGVAGGPVIDWSRYEIMYGERYMDHPEENPEGYNASNLLNKAKNLKGRLLLIHGAIDPVVVWQHSLLFLNKCIEEGVQPDYFVYPSHPHNVSGRDRLHLYEKITRYFEDFLHDL
ncbi:MAG: S9 family peptidase [Tannerella sp.]|nr:S9 family peptidase [Tannerella sp.]